jgi:hypothetical protein
VSVSSWVLVGCAVALPLCLLVAALARTADDPHERDQADIDRQFADITAQYEE